jgi:hypothetical protein
VPEIPFNAHISDMQKLSYLEEHLDYIQISILEKCEVLGIPNNPELLKTYSVSSENPLSYELQLEKLIQNKEMTIEKINEIRG